MMEVIERAKIADSRTKGYKFTCSDSPNKCAECAKALVLFITQNVEEAYKHSKRNGVAMWVSKD